MNKILKFNKKLKKKVFTLCILDYSRKSNRVIEVLGSYNIVNKNLHINVFRLAYWLSKNIEVSGNVFQVLLRFNIIDLKKIVNGDK